MNQRQRSLLTEIERDALDDTKSLSSVLLKCVALGECNGSTQLSELAAKELNGYDGTSGVTHIPAYRTVPAHIYVNGWQGPHRVYRQRVGPSQIPEFARESINEEIVLTNSVAEIENFAESARQAGGSVPFGIPGGVELARLIDYASGNQLQRIESLYWSVSEAALRGVLNQVRTTVANLVGQLQASLPDSPAVPTAAEGSHGVHVTVNGRGSNVSVSAAQSSGNARSTVNEQSADEGQFWTRTRLTGAFVVGLCTIVGTAAAVIPLFK
ncbi:AbiTii domain-containing protein [Streptomyces phaeochromogenes]